MDSTTLPANTTSGGDSGSSPQVIDSSALSDIATNGKMLAQSISNLTQAVGAMNDIVLPAVNGGTGHDVYTIGDILAADTTTTLALISDVAAGRAFVSGGVNTLPLYGTVTLTQPATAATLTIANNKTLTVSNSGTLAGGDAFTLAIAANKTLTASNSLTLAGTDGKTLTISNSLMLAGTDATTMTFPSTNGTIAALNIADQTLSGGANVTSTNLGTKSSGTLTIDCGTCPLQYVTNGGAFTLAAPSNDGSCIVLMTNNGSAGAVTFSGFTVGTSTGDALTTTNGNKFMISIARINSVSAYNIQALQ